MAVTDPALQEKLTKEQYAICHLGGTEAPFTGTYWNHHETGVYHCAVCNQPLFTSTTKFESGSGWPSFFQPVTDDALQMLEDTSHNMIRTEIRCGKCGSHIGHVFDDGPQPTGKRFCTNSTSLHFISATEHHG